MRTTRDAAKSAPNTKDVAAAARGSAARASGRTSFAKVPAADRDVHRIKLGHPLRDRVIEVLRVTHVDRPEIGHDQVDALEAHPGQVAKRAAHAGHPVFGIVTKRQRGFVVDRSAAQKDRRVTRPVAVDEPARELRGGHVPFEGRHEDAGRHHPQGSTPERSALRDATLAPVSCSSGNTPLP